jgi:adenosine deaminase
MQNSSSEIRNFCHLIPKVDIHCHLMGTIRHETMKQLAAKNEASVSQEDIDSFYIRGEKPVGVLHILRALEGGILKTPDDLFRVTYEYLEDASKHNVLHTEFFYNFTGLLNNTDNSYDEIQAGILRGIADAQTDFGISSHLIPSIDREADPAFAVQLVEAMIENRADRVYGIGIDYRENEFPPELFHEAYSLAKKAGIKSTAHAGEFGTPCNNVATALD